MEPSAAEAESCEKTPDLAFNPGRFDVKCGSKRAYDDERRELFQPSRRQVRDARAWLVRIIARRAVNILRAQETRP